MKMKKKTYVAILILDKIDFKTKDITKINKINKNPVDFSCTHTAVSKLEGCPAVN